MISADRTSEQAWADWLTSRLEPKGVGVYRARNQDEALQIVRRGQVNLAVLDNKFHRTDGLGLLRRIRSIDSVLPCLLVADEVTDRYLDMALRLQAYSVLATPVDEMVLRDLIAAVFRRFYESELWL
jgi:DNA-binding response OmpR family regulator